ncbi:MAG: hypothetical protein J6L73_03980 [Muribaculaceae bacterium]|nr:hypothetical protein [Muribaculaceae bacterium]
MYIPVRIARLRNLYHIVTVGLGATVAMLLFTSCFTGIESTPKIKLSRQDMEETVRETEEQKLLASVRPSSASEWQPGHKFVILDAKATRIFDIQSAPSPGNILHFKGISRRMSPDGRQNVILQFTDDDGTVYSHLTGRESPDEIMSDRLPMLADKEMIDSLDALLRQRNVWIITDLWLTEGDKPLKGRKYIPVTVTAVRAGSESLPYRVCFKAEGLPAASVLMTGSGATASSRPFQSLFSLSDPHIRHKNISDENWEYIQRGQVKAGMTKKECRLALGSPADTDSGHDYSSTKDLWLYPDGRWLRFEDGLLIDFRK